MEPDPEPVPRRRRVRPRMLVLLAALLLLGPDRSGASEEATDGAERAERLLALDGAALWEAAQRGAGPDCRTEETSACRWARLRRASARPGWPLAWRPMVEAAGSAEPDLALEAAWALHLRVVALCEAPETLAREEVLAGEAAELAGALRKAAGRAGLPQVRRLLGYAAACAELLSSEGAEER